MSVIFLDDQERRRFADYLAQEAYSNEGTAEQIEKMGGPTAIVAKKLRMEAAAFRFVERWLRSIETMTIGGGEERTADE